MDKIKQYLYYFLIGIISLIALLFLPMIGTSVGLAWNVPDTTVGWIVWIVTKLIIAVINILIFHCFMCQAKVNVKDNENYKKARAILVEQKVKEVLPKSPHKWNMEQYGMKGITIFVTSALSTVALTQALLTFDWISMLTYLFVIVTGLIFGILQMRTAEEYWTNEYLEYAMMYKQQQEELACQNTVLMGSNSAETGSLVSSIEKGSNDGNNTQRNSENQGELHDNN